MQRFFYFLILFQCLWRGCDALDIKANAESILLINADTGAVIFEKDADKVQYPASCTKIATALYALNRGEVSLESILTAEGDAMTPTTEAAKKKANYSLPPHWLETDGCHIGLKVGEQMSLRDLLYGALMRSANDASNVLAQYIGGSVSQFMDGLNDYLREIGCTSTHYVNPHGLHHPNHTTTARDLALMTREALKNPKFAEMVSTVHHTRPKTNLQEPTAMIHSNRLLRHGPHYYSKAIGVKTGYHALALHNMVAAARQDDRTLILVLMHAPDRKEMFNDVKRVFEVAFQEPKVERVLLQAGLQPYALKLPGSRTPIETYLADSVSYAYYPSEEPPITALIYWDAITLPVQKGQRLGEIRFFADKQRLITSAPLYAVKDVQQSLGSGISAVFAKTKLWMWAILLIITAAILYYAFRR